ncbi:unnamed protein product [Caenorhabditis nigoni]
MSSPNSPNRTETEIPYSTWRVQQDLMKLRIQQPQPPVVRYRPVFVRPIMIVPVGVVIFPIVVVPLPVHISRFEGSPIFLPAKKIMLRVL